MIFWYDKQGQPIEGTEAAEKLMADREYRIIAQADTPKGKYWVSTIWLGLDHDFGYGSHNGEINPHPIIFETMVFHGDRRTLEGYDQLDMERYSTEAQAKRGHKKWLNEYTKRESLEATENR